ncbi:MAG: hypothetical protein NVV73_07085 [Cellvibrionaceae bacterium]|nr:hypothetical protein [Cellvibrionaceae bacterium]
MIYEAWLAEALLGAYRVAHCLSEDDGKRFIAYFKLYHQIVDEAELAREAILAVSEACIYLYGSAPSGRNSDVIIFRSSSINLDNRNPL